MGDLYGYGYFAPRYVRQKTRGKIESRSLCPKGAGGVADQCLTRLMKRAGDFLLRPFDGLREGARITAIHFSQPTMSLDSLFSSLTNSKIDPKALLGGLLGSPGTQGALGGAASGALVSLLMNGKARKVIQKNAVKVGGAAALAGVGYYAYRKWQESQGAGAATNTAAPVQALPATVEPATPPPLPGDLADASVQVTVTGELPMKMVLAMIAAAAADGTIDSIEMSMLAVAIDDAPVEAGEKARLTSALNFPPTVEDIAKLANGPEEASEIYGAALTSIEVDTPSEHLFLRRLSKALELDEQLVKTVHETLEKA